MNKKYEHDFSWGDTVGIRNIMLKNAPFLNIFIQDWNSFGYPPHEGSEELIGLTKELIKDLTGKEYRYVLITNGATSGLNAYIYAAKKECTEYLYTRKMHFSFYPGIAKVNGLHHIKKDRIDFELDGQIAIIDSPSNPEGEVFFGGPKKGVVWDAVYYTPTYCGVWENNKLVCIKAIPEHDAMVGSYNKLTGINGLRVGWLATDDEEIYNKASEYITYHLCGVSWPSQNAIIHILKNVDLQKFYKESKALIDNNKSELSRLKNIFHNQPIPWKGMFALFEVNNRIKQLLEKASVKVMPGSAIGDDKDSVRFNLSRSNEDTKAMVDAILRADRK